MVNEVAAELGEAQASASGAQLAAPGGRALFCAVFVAALAHPHPPPHLPCNLSSAAGAHAGAVPAGLPHGVPVLGRRLAAAGLATVRIGSCLMDLLVAPVAERQRLLGPIVRAGAA